MDLDEFWTLIERSGEHYRQRALRLKWLEMRLAELPMTDIVDFHIHLDTCRTRVDTQDMWGAAHQICDGIGGDSFWYFQVWLFSLGRKAFEHAATDPDNLADLDAVRRLAGKNRMEWTDEQWPEWEGLSWVARYAYDAAIGVEPEGEAIEELLAARGHSSPCEPADPGEWWDLDDPAEAGRRYPRLAEIFPRTGKYRVLVPDEVPYPPAENPTWHVYDAHGSTWMDPEPEVLAVFLHDIRSPGDQLVLYPVAADEVYAQVDRVDEGYVVSLHNGDEPAEWTFCATEREGLAALVGWMSDVPGWRAAFTWVPA